MKKITLLIILAVVLCFNIIFVDAKEAEKGAVTESTMNVIDELEPIPVIFKKSGGGQFIYCNNPEFIKPKDLSTIENPDATYLMKNEKLKPGKYSVFFCLYNSTGFDIEPDIEFTSSSNATVTIDAIGYEMPKPGDFWDCMSAWADYKNINIRTLNFEEQYTPFQGVKKVPARFELNNSTQWINKYIYNYDTVKPNFTFNMLVDFTVKSGEVDANFAVLKSYGIKGDRSLHNKNAKKGMYYRDTSVKGIDKETLPMVELDIDMEINNKLKDGDAVDFKIFNQFFNDGNVAPHFVTNINPARDMYMFSKGVAAGSDMLNLEYEDDTKLQFYGANVPQEDRNNIWKFDIYHHNTREYMKEMPWKEEDYVPNAFTSKTLDIKNLPNTEWELNLGNFGVTTRFNLKIINATQIPRSINYILDTSLSSNILILRDKEGNILNPYTHKKSNPYALSKGINQKKKEECMFSTTVKPGEIKEYILDIILPTNCYGGMLHSFKVDSKEYLSEKPATTFSDYKAKYPNKDIFFNGEEYMKWDGGELYKYNNLGYWEHMLMPGYAKKLFESNSTNFRVVKTKEGYAVRFTAWDNFDFWIVDKTSRQKVYFFDEKFNLLREHKFSSYIEDMFYRNGELYILSDATYTSTDNINFKKDPYATSFPASNGNYTLIPQANGLFLKDIYGKTSKISYESMSAPKNVYSAGEIFYYKKSWKKSYIDNQTKNILSVSADGIMWVDLELPDKFYQLLDISYYEDKIYVDGRYETMVFDIKFDTELTKVKLNDEILAFKVPPTTIEGRTMVPLRFFFEKLGAKVSWVDETQEIIVTQKNKTINLKINNKTATVNGIETEMDVPPTIINEKTIIPTRFLAENLGYEIVWDEKTKTVEIKVINEEQIEKEQIEKLKNKYPKSELMPYINDLSQYQEIKVSDNIITIIPQLNEQNIVNSIKLKFGETEIIKPCDLKGKRNIYVADINEQDTFKDLIIVETKPGNIYETTIYRIEENKLVEHGKFEHYSFNPYYDKNGNIYFYHKSRIFKKFDYINKNITEI